MSRPSHRLLGEYKQLNSSGGQHDCAYPKSINATPSNPDTLDISRITSKGNEGMGKD